VVIPENKSAIQPLKWTEGLLDYLEQENTLFSMNVVLCRLRTTI